MDVTGEKALSAVTSAAELAVDADDVLQRTQDREREKADRDEDDFDQVKKTLNDAERADMSKGRDLDADRVGEIRSLMAEGGDKAVAKKFGESALASPEAAKARAQRAAIRKHESEMAMTGLRESADKDRVKTVEAKQQSKTPLRDQAIARQLGKEQGRSHGEVRGDKPAPTGEPSRTPIRDQAIARELRREQDRDRSRDSLGR